jgi:hypothetical protein
MSVSLKKLISIHEVAARDLRAGDRLSANGAAGLDNVYDTADAGQEVVVLAVGESEDMIEIVFADDYFSVLAMPYTRVWVIRPRGA